MKTRRPTPLRCLVAALASVTTLGATFAATVEFKINPELKGRAYKQALSSVSTAGRASAVAGQAGVFAIDTANETAAKSLASQLRENASVLWAAPASKPVAASEYAAKAVFHERMLVFAMKSDADAKAAVARVSADTGQTLFLRRVATGNRALVVLPKGTTAATQAAISIAAQRDQSVAAVERVQLLQHQWIPNDSLWTQQWSLGNGIGGIRAGLAWDLTPSGAVTIGIIDTGIRKHADLDGKYVAGYDMISNGYLAVDGDLRDTDPADPGDADDEFVCSFSSVGALSSWHGTHVAGIAAANTQNGEGIAGVAPNARIQSIRGLGRCGGTFDDIADSIRWAAGAPVGGAPINTNPVKVMNLSLGGSAPCGANMQSAVDAALARGVAVVVAAGNDADLVATQTPANCKGVIVVGASEFLGNLSSFSNFGPEVTLLAPGGDGGVGQPGILSTLNGGGTQPGVPSYASYIGTSMASPHVAGVVALMLARDPSLTPGQIANRLQTSARAFPVTSECFGTTGACGAGLLDAANAVASVAINRGVNEVSNSRERVHLVEMVEAASGRYTLSADPVEVARMSAAGWSKTGQVIPTYSFTTIGQAIALPQPVCRATLLGHNARRFSANVGECSAYTPETGHAYDGVVFAAAIPNSNLCPRGSSPAWEIARRDPLTNLYNMRTLSNTIELDAMVAQGTGWEYSRVAFCVPN